MIDIATEDTVSLCSGRETLGDIRAKSKAVESEAGAQPPPGEKAVVDPATLEAQRGHTQRLASIGQLAVGIAHEINSPTQYIGDNVRFLRDAFEGLRPVLAACSALREAVERDGAAEEAGAALAQAVEQADDLEYVLGEIPKAIQDSLEGVDDVSRIIRSVKELSHPGGEEKQAIDLHRAVEIALTVSHNEWKHVAEAVTDLASDLPQVRCRPGDLDQVLVNLIVNAAHAIEAKAIDGAGERGTITVRARQADEWIEVEVADTGTGIPEAIRARVFEPFFTTKKADRGTGQGLSIARAIVVDRYGGDLTFETGEGRGTTFRIRIPVCPPN